MRASFAIAIILAAFSALGCESNSAVPNVTAGRFQEQVDAYDRQTAKVEELLKQQEAELERTLTHNDRYEKLLTKWEEQARRMDAVIEADEKRTGVR